MAGQPASGAGPALVLLHGWTATAAVNWVHCFGPLAAAGHLVIGMDQRGHGRGLRPPPLRGFRLEDCADDVIALADALGIDQVVPVGYSMGGPVAQLVWRRHPDRVAGLVLCATARNFRGTSELRPGRMALVGGVTGMATALRALPPVVRRRATQASVVWRKRALGMPDWILEEIGRNDPAAMLEGFRALQSFNSSAWIGEVNVPAAVVVTTGDHVVPPSRQRKLAAAIPGASVWEAHGDHDMCVTRPRLFPRVLVGACGAVVGSVGVQGRR
jgi:pimeloyl-ACP methyl ester carboxylesterase